MQGTARGANASRKHRNAVARHCFARTKRSRDDTPAFKETPVLQLFLSSPNNTHRDDCEFKQIVGSGQKRCFADSESRFLATKIFSGKSAFCSIAARNGELFRNFPKTDSQTDAGRETFSKSRGQDRAGARRVEKWKAN